jgi:hypothetical protein
MAQIKKINGITIPNTSVSGLTWNLNNTLTVENTNGTSLSTNISSFSGLTIFGSLSATTFYGDGSNLTGITSENTSITGTSILDFNFSGGSEGDLASTIVINSNIKSSSFIMYNIIPSTDHETAMDSLLEGIIINTSDIIDGYGFTINAIATNNTWGIYNLNYKIIN